MTDVSNAWHSLGYIAIRGPYMMKPYIYNNFTIPRIPVTE